MRHRTGRRTSPGFPCIGAALLGLTLAGCLSRPGSFRSPETTKYTLENTDAWAALDASAHRKVTCTGLQDHTLADGALEVVANLKNVTDEPTAIETDCVFKDRLDLPTGDETPWQTVMLEKNETKAVHFTSRLAMSQKYTVRIREVPQEP